MKRRPIVISLRAATAVVLTAAIAIPAAPASAAPASASTGRPAAAIPVLKVGMAESFTSLDPTVPGGAFDTIPDSLALEQLQVIGTNGRLENWLATKVSQPSPTTYVFALRHRVDFWDGSELTSADVVSSLDYARRPGSHYAGELAPVNGVTAEGPYTVSVSLSQPDAAFLFSLADANSYIFEKRFFDEHKTTYGQPGTLTMGTGPWEVQSLDPTSGVTLVANPHWWGGPAPVQKIMVSFFSNETSEALAMRAGEIDVAPLVENGTQFAATSGAHLTYVPSCNNAFITMPTQTAPWSDVHVRRAVAYAVNRAAVIASTGFRAVPTYTLIEPSQLETLGSQAQVNAIVQPLPKYPYNLAAAKQQMAESSVPKGFSTVLKTFNYGSFLNVDQVIANDLAKIGITVKIQDMQQAAWFSAMEGQSGPRPFSYTTAGGCSPDPSFQNIWLGSQNAKSGGLNVADWTPPVMDQLLTKSLDATTSVGRLAVYAKMLQLLAIDEPYVPLYEQDVSYASNDYTWPGFNQFWGASVWALDLKHR
jgi:peptide/nickel transport system substrate-binding protein